MQWVLIDRVGHLAYYILTKISGLNQSNTDSQEARHFSTIKVVDQAVDPGPAEVDGWTADGWREEDIAAAHTIEPTGTVTMAGDITIYAVYRRNATFYSGLNKASSATATQYYNTTNKYSLLTLPSTSAASMDGYTPIKWISAGGNDIDFNSRYTDSGNVFYAKYTRPATFYHGLNKASNTTATQTYVSDNHYSLTAPAISQATSLGNGWNAVDWLQTDDNVHLAGSGIYTGSRSVFYAHYSRSITINYTAGGGTGSTTATTGTSYYNSSNATTSNQLTLASNNFSRTGYSFNGWDLGAAGGKVTFDVEDAASKTATAQWAGYTYTVKYNQGTATSGWNATTYAQQSATYPTEITLRTNDMAKSNTKKSGSEYTITFNSNGGSACAAQSTYVPIVYTKNGWTTTSGSTTRVYANGDKYSNTTTNGSTLDLYPCFSQSEDPRTTITMPTPTLTNMTCTGWWSASSGGTKSFICGANYNNITKSQTVYAQWTNATARLGTATNTYSVAYGTSSGGSENYYYVQKTRFRVKFELLAGKTWQNMVDDSNYKWPVYYYCKYCTNSRYSSSGVWWNEATYTTRAALKAAVEDAGTASREWIKNACLASRPLAAEDINGRVGDTETVYTWYPSYVKMPSGNVVYFRPVAYGYESSKNTPMVNLGCLGTTSDIIYYTRSYSSGSWNNYFPKNPLEASATISLSDVNNKKYYIMSDTAVTDNDRTSSASNYQMKAID